MKLNFNYLLLLFIIIIHSTSCYGQKQFVTFETTAKGATICQGKTIGVIAKLTPAFEENKNFRWAGDLENFQEVKDEIAIVNTSKPGKKRLKFTLILSESKKLDTVYIVNVNPNPEVIISFSSSTLSFANKNNTNIVSFRWKYKGALVPEITDSIIKNPKIGPYQVFVIDNNGCKGMSQIINVE